MRVMVWTNSFWPHIGGVEVLGVKLFRALTARNYEFTVITRKDTEDLADHEVLDRLDIYRLRFSEVLHSKSVSAIMNLRDQVATLKRQKSPDLYYMYHPTPGVIFHEQTKTVEPAPVVTTLHQNYPDSAVQPKTLFGHLFRSANWNTTCSNAVLETIRKQIPDIIPITSAIPNSLEPPAIAPEPLPFNPPRLLCLGRVEPQKGFDLAVESLRLLLERFPNLKLMIAGDGSALPALKHTASECGISNSVEFLGWVMPQKVSALINQATLVVMPSRIEPFGLVALQAAQMARPIVSTAMEGLQEIIMDGETGRLVEEPTPANFARAIEALLLNADSATAMGKNARTHAANNFGWEQFVDEYDALFRTVVRG